MALRITGLSPVQVTACLSWYDEDPDMLRKMVASLPKAGVTRLVAVDGRYRLFGAADHGGFRSTPEEHVALWETCKAVGIELVTDIPQSEYPTEREKRQRLFSLAESYAERGDWLLWIDGDETVGDWLDPDDRTLSDHLRTTSKDVAEVTFYDHSPDGGDTLRYWQLPRFFRAGQFDRMGPNHYTLLRRDNSALWGNGAYRKLADSHILPLSIRHMQRSPERADRERAFIQNRDRLEPEPERWDLHRSLSPEQRKRMFPLAGEYEVRTT